MLRANLCYFSLKSFVYLHFTQVRTVLIKVSTRVTTEQNWNMEMKVKQLLMTEFKS